MRAPVAQLHPGNYRFSHRLRVRFAETDAMGVAHHSSYLLYLETARVEYLRSLSHPYDRLRDEGLELPVVELAARYLRPLRFDEEVDVHLRVNRAGGASFELGYLLTVAGEPRATATTRHAVTVAAGRPVRCPGWLVDLSNG